MPSEDDDILQSQRDASPEAPLEAPAYAPREAPANDAVEPEESLEAALQLALEEELARDSGARVRWFVYGVIALVLCGFVAMFVYTWAAPP